MKNAQLMILLGTLAISAGSLVIPASASAAGLGAGANVGVEVQGGTMSPGDAKVGGSNAGHVDIEGSLKQNPQATPDPMGTPEQMTEGGDSERAPSAPSKTAEKKTKPISTTDTE